MAQGPRPQPARLIAVPPALDARCAQQHPPISTASAPHACSVDSAVEPQLLKKLTGLPAAEQLLARGSCRATPWRASAELICSDRRTGWALISG